jgi:hypothetical protein
MTTLLLTLFMMATPEPVVQTCLTYEPDAVSLTGTIRRHTFPGAPRYESVAKGDRPERVWVFQLSRPICVAARGDWEEEKNISDLQLVFAGAEKDYARYRRLLGRQVTIKGAIFHAHTGHHHTKVLLTVSSVSVRARP